MLLGCERFVTRIFIEILKKMLKRTKKTSKALHESPHGLGSIVCGGVGWGGVTGVCGGALKEPWVEGRTFCPRRTRAYMASATVARGVARQKNSKNLVGGCPKRALGRGANVLPAENARLHGVGNISEGRCTPKKFRK